MNVRSLKLDAELSRLEKLSENDIERMRAQRLETMKQEHKKRQEWITNGDSSLIESSSMIIFRLFRTW